jgi:uncharacterized membrane protein YbhN (UPF0104 family)
MSPSKSFKIILSLLVIIFMGLMLFFYLDDFIYLFSQLDYLPLLFLIGLQVPIIGIGGYPFKRLMNCFGYQIHWHHWLGLSFVSNLLNQLLPYRPGIAFRYIFLKKHYDLPIKTYTFTTLFYFGILVLSSSLMIIIPWIFYDLPASFDEHLLLACIVLFSAILAAGLIRLIFSLKNKISPNSNPKNISFLPQVKAVLNDFPSMLACLTGFCIIQALIVISFLIIFSALGKPLILSHAFFIVGVTTLGLLFPITPGNLGVLEGLMGGLTQALYGNFGLGFGAVIIYRIAQFLIAILFGSIFSYILLGSVLPIKKANT